MSNSPRALKSSLSGTTVAKTSKNPTSYAAAVKGILRNKSDVTKATPALPGTSQFEAEKRGLGQSRTIFRQHSLTDENSKTFETFQPQKNFKAISAKNVKTLEGTAPVSPEQSQYKPASKLRFNELVTVLFIDPEGLSLRTPSLYPTEQQRKAKLDKLANDVADCLVRDVTTKPDLLNIKTILEKMINENPKNINRSPRVAEMTGTEMCLVHFTKQNIALLDSYYYEYEPDKGVKMSYLDYAVTLAIERFTQNYNSVTERMKRSLIDLYTSIMKYVGGSSGGRKTRRSKKSKKRKLSKRRSSKQRTLKKR